MGSRGSGTRAEREIGTLRSALPSTRRSADLSSKVWLRTPREKHENDE